MSASRPDRAGFRLRVQRWRTWHRTICVLPTGAEAKLRSREMPRWNLTTNGKQIISAVIRLGFAVQRLCPLWVISRHMQRKTPKADMCGAVARVGFGPKADIKSFIRSPLGLSDNAPVTGHLADRSHQFGHVLYIHLYHRATAILLYCP